MTRSEILARLAELKEVHAKAMANKQFNKANELHRLRTELKRLLKETK